MKKKGGKGAKGEAREFFFIAGIVCRVVGVLHVMRFVANENLWQMAGEPGWTKHRGVDPKMLVINENNNKYMA